jgi:hypothetical protein
LFHIYIMEQSDTFKRKNQMKKTTFSSLLLLSLFLLLTDHQDLNAMKTRSKDRHCQDALEPLAKKQKIASEHIVTVQRSQKIIPSPPTPTINKKNKMFNQKKYFFKCEMCGKSLNSNNALKYHVMAHNGIMPHKCGCGKGYTQKGNLKKHMEKCSQKKENDTTLAEILDGFDGVSHPQINLEQDVEQYLKANHHIDELDINNL